MESTRPDNGEGKNTGIITPVAGADLSRIALGRGTFPTSEEHSYTKFITSREGYSPYTRRAGVMAALSWVLLAIHMATQIIGVLSGHMASSGFSSVGSGSSTTSLEWLIMFMATTILGILFSYRALDDPIHYSIGVNKLQIAKVSLIASWCSVAVFAVLFCLAWILGSPNPLSGLTLSGATEILAGEVEEQVFFLGSIAGGFALFQIFVSRKPSIYRSSAVDEGILTLGFILAGTWQFYVLRFHADPSVVGWYAFSYFMIGLWISFQFGKMGARWTTGSDFTSIGERENVPVAIIYAAFMLATGLVFGGSLWGEADPSGDGEGGWWIPGVFFTTGWLTLVLLGCVGWRRVVSHCGKFDTERPPGRVSGIFSMYLLSCAWVVFGQVSGDFYGWSNGLVPLLSAGGLILIQELFLVRGGKGDEGGLWLEFLSFAGFIAVYHLGEVFL
jgi:hypothetical protein